MKTLLAVATTGLFALSLAAGVPAAMAQGQQPQAPAAKPAPMEAGKSVQGTIKTLTGNTLMLEDGTKLMLSNALVIKREELQPGAIIKANYEDRAGQKVATSLEVVK